MEGVSIITFNGKTPKIDPSAFVAPGCRIIGDVEIGPEASIWYNCVLRGDVNFIRIGARTKYSGRHRHPLRFGAWYGRGLSLDHRR